ncbi:MAG: long-chain fatty acid--CoA ligase [Novosphingobium sp.]|nr:long-chain fatty acid--CoA ligase [Novosphingobium sp.]
MATISAAQDVALEREAEAWMNDPYEHFGYDNTKIHSLDREHVEAVQLAAMNIRLAQRRQDVQMLAKLADSQGIDRIDTLDGLAPLLFPHDIYKSYPVSLLVRQRYDKLNQWLTKLTRHSPEEVDVSDCDSIDSWLTRLRDETPLDVGASSGSSGTCSFYPKSKRDYFLSMMGERVQLVQKSGEPVTRADIEDKIHVIIPLYKDGHASMGAFGKYSCQVFAKGDERYWHYCFDFKLSQDLMWLAARLRAAQAKGDISKVDVPPSLLARRAEWEQQQKDMPAQQLAFVQRMVKELAGERVIVMSTSNLLYAVAKRGLEEGISGVFAPNSVFMGGGGAKGVPLPDDLEEVICSFFNTDRMISSYGMTEMNSFSVQCEHDRYHLLPFVTPYLLDLETGQPLPRKGVQTGRASFFDMTAESCWGGIVTGDVVTIDWDLRCPCGRTSLALEKQINRVSEIRGGDDKISCAATPQAQAEAMDFLTGIGG